MRHKFDVLKNERCTAQNHVGKNVLINNDATVISSSTEETNKNTTSTSKVKWNKWINKNSSNNNMNGDRISNGGRNDWNNGKRKKNIAMAIITIATAIKAITTAITT